MDENVRKRCRAALFHTSAASIVIGGFAVISFGTSDAGRLVATPFRDFGLPMPLSVSCGFVREGEAEPLPGILRSRKNRLQTGGGSVILKEEIRRNDFRQGDAAGQGARADVCGTVFRNDP